MTKKTIAKSFVELNSIKNTNDDSVVSFAQPLAITDESRQWNMTKYDVNTLDIESYDGAVTADHGNKITDVIGKVINLRKENGRVLIDGIKFAVKENPVAILAKNLMKGGFVTGVSIETIGGDPAPDGTWLNHSLCGLSIVAHPNNKNAYAVISNSLQEAQTNGFDVSKFSEEYKQKIEIEDRHDRVMNKIEGIYTILNGGKGSGNHAPGQGRGVGKPASGGSSTGSGSKHEVSYGEFQNIVSSWMKKTEKKIKDSESDDDSEPYRLSAEKVKKYGKSAKSGLEKLGTGGPGELYDNSETIKDVKRAETQIEEAIKLYEKFKKSGLYVGETKDATNSKLLIDSAKETLSDSIRACEDTVKELEREYKNTEESSFKLDADSYNGVLSDLKDVKKAADKISLKIDVIDSAAKELDKYKIAR